MNAASSCLAREYAIKHHGDQRYGDLPYSVHLDAVAELLHDYADPAVTTIAYLHDVIEDTPVVEADIASVFGEFVARCVSSVSDEGGQSRQERKQKTYRKLAQVEADSQECLALVVKTADRLANFQSCVATHNAKKLKMYLSEHSAFRQAVYREGLCENLWEKIDRIVSCHGVDHSTLGLR